MFRFLRTWKRMSDDEQDAVMTKIFDSWYYAAFIIVMNIIGLAYVGSMFVELVRELS